MLVAVVGGNLQGVEATYLAQKAGWEVLLIDKTADVPASGFSNSFIQMDVTRRDELRRAIKGADLVIPALENDGAIYALVHEANNAGVPIAFDPDAYGISSSKIKSNRVFSKIGVPVPGPWPECGLPVIAKPSKSSGSKGVRVFSSEKETEAFVASNFSSASWVLQEFVQGPSYSLEVLGVDRKYFPLQVTDLHMDEAYDCKRVTAPSVLPPGLVEQFKVISIHIARALNLEGIMDVEVVVNNGELKVLEIDARLPSQTPTTVYWSSGLNVVQMIGKIFVSKHLTMPEVTDFRGVVYEHVRVSPGLLEVVGEHIMTGYGPLKLQSGFFGADEAITSYAEGRDHWVATLITAEAELLEAQSKMERVIKALRKSFRIERVVDSTPDVPDEKS